jgi:peptidoglycan-associated lipoprotein
MKRFAIILSTLLVAACASEPAKEQPGAAVEDRAKDKPQVVDRQPVKPAQPEAKGLKTDPFSGTALRDPNSILAKRSVFFDYDSTLVKDEYKPLVTAHAQFLQKNPSYKMRIEGNADDRGSREYNIALGQRRAEAVKQMMQLLGARSEQIEAVSFGEEKPRCSDPAESCWSQNRRGDIAYQGE